MRRAGGDPREREYERHRAVVLKMLAKRFPRLDEDERLAIYHDAWARVLVKRERGETIVSLRAYLLATCGAEALHMLSRHKMPTPLGPDDPRLIALADTAPPVDEQVVVRDQVRIARDLLDTLDERQRDVLKLRWDLQLSSAEVRAALGLSARQYKRLAEEGAAALADRIAELEGGEWSLRTRSLLVACLVEVTRDGERQVGIASQRQREEAQRLLDSDPHVAALYAELRRSVRGVVALLPLPVLAVDSTGPLTTRVAELASELLNGAKQHATSVYLRVGDPSLLAGGPRPGTAVVAVAGLLAVSGGAYGAHEAVSSSDPAATPKPAISAPPARVTTSAPVPTRATRSVIDSKPKAKPEPKVIASPAAEPVPQPQPIPSTPTSPNPPPTQSTPPTEFGFED